MKGLYLDRITRTRNFISRLAALNLERQLFKTLKGQAVAGDIEGAEKGLERVLRGETDGQKK